MFQDIKTLITFERLSVWIKEMHGWYLLYLMMTLLWKPNSSHSLHVSSRCGDYPKSCGRSRIGLTCSSVSLGIPYINLVKSFYFSFSISLYERSIYGLDTFSSKSLFLIIMGKKTKLVHVQHITSLYSNEEMIDKFHHETLFKGWKGEYGYLQWAICPLFLYPLSCYLWVES